MDTKSQNKVLSISILFLIVVLTAAAFMACGEKKLSFNENSVSYFKNSAEINKEVIRYAKNLQRYYIYYSSFDVDKATLKLSEIDNYISTGEAVPMPKSFNANIQPFSNKNSNENENSTSDINDSYNVQNPENLYNFDIQNSTVDNLITRQSELSDAINNYNSIENYLLTNEDFHYSIYSNILCPVIATNTNDFYKEGSYETINIKDPIFSINFNNKILNTSFEENGDLIVIFLYQLQHLVL